MTVSASSRRPCPPTARRERRRSQSGRQPRRSPPTLAAALSLSLALGVTCLMAPVTVSAAASSTSSTIAPADRAAEAPDEPSPAGDGRAGDGRADDTDPDALAEGEGEGEGEAEEAPLSRQERRERRAAERKRAKEAKRAGEPKKAKEKAKEKPPERLEFGGLPATNYDSDLGVGFGVIASLAKFKPGYNPYRWRIQMLLYATAKKAPGGGVELPYHEDYLQIDVPGLLENRLRINADLGFRKFATTGYYGIGNGSESLRPWEEFDPDTQKDEFTAARRYHQYDRIFPGFTANARIRAWDGSIEAHRRRLEFFVGTYFSYNVMRPYPGSKLSEDIEAAKADTPDGRTLDRLLNGTDNHALLRLNLGLIWDTRDHEFAPTRGTFTELSTRISPGVDDKLYHAGFTLNTSWYRSLVGSYLVLATRAVGDVMVGNVPVWELTRFGALLSRDGPGGSWSVRGVPRQRFSGKRKFVSNVELRSEFLPFRIKNQRFVIGAIAFVDTGRVWADVRRTELGGRSVDGGGLAVGVGGGLRVRWGETFIVRVDPSYSPTEENFGIYIDIGHIF